jgi:molybdopterin synthase catalytic subunit
VQVTVRLFGVVREAAGARELRIELPAGAKVSDLRALLERDQPLLRSLGSRLRVAVNQELSAEVRSLREGDEVAFLPPVSGGGGRCTLGEAPLDLAAVVARVAGPDAGGVVTFTGAVRASSRGRDIRHLEYEAYPGMAEAELERIADEAAARWPGVRVAMAHRTGRLEIGEVAVVVAVAARHRGPAFAAAAWVMDEIKRVVPIWKLEDWADGPATWTHPGLESAP